VIPMLRLEREVKMTNSIQIITPYSYNGTWVFDDPNTDLVREPFVAGVPDVLEALLAHRNIDGQNGFNLLFSAMAFPGHQAVAEWLREEGGGNWYRCGLPSGEVGEGWLCPALLKYFKEPPKKLYFQVASKNTVTKEVMSSEGV
jgi:hypothetical protein